MRYPSVVAVEIDRGLIPVLGYTLSECPDGVVSVINADVMKVDLDELLAPAFEKGPVSVCANLPYYITTPILMRFIEKANKVKSLTESILVDSEILDIDKCKNRILAEINFSCPPAVPIAISGEIITDEIIKECKYYGIKKLKVIKE